VKGLQGLTESSRANATLDASTAEAFKRLGDVLVLLGKPAEARGAFDEYRILAEKLAGGIRLLRAHPESAILWQNKVVAYERLASVCLPLGDLTAARKYAEAALQTALEMDKVLQGKQVQENLAVAYQRLGNLSLQAHADREARDYFTRSLKAH